MSVTKEIDRISSEIAKELEPKLFEMISWGLDKDFIIKKNGEKMNLSNVEGDEFIELITYIANKSIEKLTKSINK
tara:strand:+ start:487 stop:711 length:225 start_codon:yes stop_codon:yes gene_type:complete